MSLSYRAPLEESLFLLNKVLNWQGLFKYEKYAHVDEELGTAILTEGAKFSSEVIAPLNREGDEKGSHLIKGRVITPDGFKEAFASFAEAGWASLDLPEKYGGQNLPLSLQLAFAEMINGACLSFAMLPLMLRASAALLIEHAEKELVERVVPKLVSAEWGATICISEAQAGSDVGRIKTRAVLQDDGRYKLSGSKMFITYADQDFTEQIVHLVLARTENSPPGTRGISLFLVPRIDLDSGEINSLSVSRVEKKMGLKASPTCVLDLDGAIAYRIGEETRGLMCMFTMVNMMRLEVSIQGPAIAWAATRMAEDYAAERKQGGSPDMPPLALDQHADIRRMLLTMRSKTEAMRALVFEAAFNLDLSAAETNKEKALIARQLAEFLLPVCKAAGSETGFEVANLALQIYGGHGYIRDNGVEQYVRDSRVSMIYEGANGIQALDLVTRKLLKDEGLRYNLFRSRILEDIEKENCGEAAGAIRNKVADALILLDRASEYLLDKQSRTEKDVQAAATDYLNLVALLGGAWMWFRMLSCVKEGTEFERNKIDAGNFYIKRLLPEGQILLERIEMGADYLETQQ